LYIRTHSPSSAPPGTVESYGTSTGSAIASLTERSCYQYRAEATSDDQEHLVPAYQPGDFASVDVYANISTSDQVREFYGQQSQCAESAFPHGHRGANFTDNPQPTTSQTGRCAPPTNGTPPNNVNPVVCASLNYYPSRPNLLPGVHQGRPIPVTTNDTRMKNLSPYLNSTGFLPPPVLLYGQAMRRDQMTHSPIQQASDVGNGVLNRDQACYIQPNQMGRNVLQNHLHSQLSPSELPDVRTEGFPHSSKYSSVSEGVLIYCSEVGCTW
jgi:hypothetical protein